MALQRIVQIPETSSEQSMSDSIEIKIAKFLAGYRDTPHSITGRMPAEVLLG